MSGAPGGPNPLSALGNVRGPLRKAGSKAHGGKRMETMNPHGQRTGTGPGAASPVPGGRAVGPVGRKILAQPTAGPPSVAPPGRGAMIPGQGYGGYGRLDQWLQRRNQAMGGGPFGNKMGLGPK